MKITLALVLVVCTTQGGQAELFNQGYYGPGKQGGITDPHSYDAAQFNLNVLFNTYFADQLTTLGKNTYGSSNDLFLDRGVAGVEEWIALEEVQVFGVNRVADLYHNLHFNFQGGPTLSTGWLNANTGATEFLSLGSLDKLGETGVFTMTLDTYYAPWNRDIGTVKANSIEYGNGVWDDCVHMIAFDVTDLMQAMLGIENVQSAYMFCWEDLVLGPTNGWGLPADWDFQDLVYIMINVRHEGDNNGYETAATPEPATALILLVGLVAYPLTRKRRGKPN